MLNNNCVKNSQADPGLVNGVSQGQADGAKRVGVERLCLSPEKFSNLDLKYLTGGAFWGFFPVQLAGLNAAWFAEFNQCYAPGRHIMRMV